MSENDPPDSTGSTATSDAPSTKHELAPERAFCTFESFDYDGAKGAYRVLFDPDTVGASTAVVSALAAITDTDPVKIEPLYTAVDPVCLDSIAAKQPSTGDVEMGFPLNGYFVRVKSSGSIEVTPS